MSNASLIKPGDTTQIKTNRVFKNPVFSKFNNYQEQQKPSSNWQEPIKSMRRNYYSATESCGEETDIDDSVFTFDNPSKQSYASIKLRAPLKDVNYYSDTETLQTNSPRNYYKQQQLNYNSPNKKSIAQAQYNTSNRHYSERSNGSIQNFNLNYQQSTPKPYAAPANANVSVYNNKQSFSLLNRQAKPFVNQSTDNPYSPSNNGSYFKVPNIYEKLQFNQQQSNKQFSFINNNNNSYQLPVEPQFHNNQIDETMINDNAARNEQGNFFFQ